jgi:copper oxidase (laccase) domain-containing protein
MIRPDYFDLWEISRHQLMDAGIREDRIELAAVCTKCRTDLFFSYRGEGTTGRFATIVMLKPGRRA